MNPGGYFPRPSHKGKKTGSHTECQQRMQQFPADSKTNGMLPGLAQFIHAGRSLMGIGAGEKPHFRVVLAMGARPLTGRGRMRHAEFVGSEHDIPWLAGAVRDQPYLAAVSGGADSVAMLHLLLDAGFTKLVVCHLDHRLRGRASTEDAKFVARMAAQFGGLPCEIGRIDVKALMKERGESMETAARHARHRFFAECSRKYQCPRILLAHHAEDQAETILWNLLRGSHGLKGMREEQRLVVQDTPISLIRPLLGVRRASLVAWLKERGIRWREDASNREPVAVRNRLLNEVIPLMNEGSCRDSVAALVRAAGDFTEMAEDVSQCLDLPSLLDPAGRLHVPSLRKRSVGMQREALRQYLIAAGVASIDRSLLEQAVGLLDHQRSAVVNLPGGRRLRRREGRLWIAD